MKNIIKDKSKFNLSVDILMLLLIMPIAGIGFLIKYVLLSGIHRNPIYGKTIDLEFFDMTRHQWGSIHLILSIIFLALLLVHIIFHWKMITGIVKRMIPNTTIRIVAAILFVSIGLLSVSFPVLISPRIVQKQSLHRNETNPNIYSSDREKKINQNGSVVNQTLRQHSKEIYEIQGKMTLKFVSEKYNVPEHIIADDLHIPRHLAGEQLGRLKKLYFFSMDDVRASITAYKRKTNK